jgi:uncharacterized membrane protein
MILDNIIIFVLLLCVFILGMIVHKHFMCSGFSHHNAGTSFLNKSSNNQTQGNKVSLDESKVVLKIDTGNMQKMSEVSVNTKITEDNTQNAISKLKNLKGK